MRVITKIPGFKSIIPKLVNKTKITNIVQLIQKAKRKKIRKCIIIQLT